MNLNGPKHSTDHDDFKMVWFVGWLTTLLSLNPIQPIWKVEMITQETNQWSLVFTLHLSLRQLSFSTFILAETGNLIELRCKFVLPSTSTQRVDNCTIISPQPHWGEAGVEGIFHSIEVSEGRCFCLYFYLMKTCLKFFCLLPISCCLGWLV